MTVALIRRTRTLSNNTCHFSSISGLPRRVGVHPTIRLAKDGVHCRASRHDGKCCCLPISQTWHMNCKEARNWLIQNNYLNPDGTGPNQVCAGGVGMSRIMMMYCLSGASAMPR